MNDAEENESKYARFWIFDIEDDIAYSKSIDRKEMRILGTLSYITSLVLSLGYIYIFDLNFLSTYYFLFIVLIFTNLTVSLLIIFIRSRNTVKKLGSVISTVTRGGAGSSPRKTQFDDSSPSRRRNVTLTTPKRRASALSNSSNARQDSNNGTGEFHILLTQVNKPNKSTDRILLEGTFTRIKRLLLYIFIGGTVGFHLSLSICYFITSKITLKSHVILFSIVAISNSMSLIAIIIFFLNIAYNIAIDFDFYEKYVNTGKISIILWRAFAITGFFYLGSLYFSIFFGSVSGTFVNDQWSILVLIIHLILTFLVIALKFVLGKLAERKRVSNSINPPSEYRA